MIKKILHLFNKKKKYKNKIIPYSFYRKWKKLNKRKKYNLKINLNIFNTNIFKNSTIINASIIFILLFVLFLIFWPLLRVNKIEIIRKDYLTNIDIAYKSLDFLRWKSIFLLNFDNIKTKLKNYQINIKDINIKLSFPDLLKIEIGSYTWLFNTNINNKNYIITENGVFIPIKKYSQIKDLKIVYKKIKNIPILDYKKVLSSKYLLKINYLINKLEENILSIKIKKSFYFKNERELHLVTKSWIRLIYDLSNTVDSQIKDTVILNKQYYKIYEGGLVYIDFRVKDKIYYCKDKIKQICLKNIDKIYNQ